MRNMAISTICELSDGNMDPFQHDFPEACGIIKLELPDSGQDLFMVCRVIEATMIYNDLQLVAMKLLQMLTRKTVQHQSDFITYLHDLPDAGQELFLQTGDVLDKFMCFPLLPAALRLKICGHILFHGARVKLTTAGRFSFPPPCVIPFCINYEHAFLGDQSDFQ